MAWADFLVDILCCLKAWSHQRVATVCSWQTVQTETQAISDLRLSRHTCLFSCKLFAFASSDVIFLSVKFRRAEAQSVIRSRQHFSRIVRERTRRHLKGATKSHCDTRFTAAANQKDFKVEPLTLCKAGEGAVLALFARCSYVIVSQQCFNN